MSDTYTILIKKGNKVMNLESAGHIVSEADGMNEGKLAAMGVVSFQPSATDNLLSR